MKMREKCGEDRSEVQISNILKFIYHIPGRVTIRADHPRGDPLSSSRSIFIFNTHSLPCTLLFTHPTLFSQICSYHHLTASSLISLSSQYSIFHLKSHHTMEIRKRIQRFLHHSHASSPTRTREVKRSPMSFGKALRARASDLLHSSSFHKKHPPIDSSHASNVSFDPVTTNQDSPMPGDPVISDQECSSVFPGEKPESKKCI